MSGSRAVKSLASKAARLVDCSSRAVSIARHAPTATLQDSEQQRILTRAYLREYARAAQNKDIGSAMEALSKAASTGQHLHMKIPNHYGCAPGGLAPMEIVVPRFSAEASRDTASTIIMPFWINLPKEEPTHYATSPQGAESSTVPVV
jgi:hypothetical protein